MTGTISTSSAASVKIGSTTYPINTTAAAVYFNGAVSGFDIATDFAMLVGSNATLVYNAAETAIVGIVAEKQTSQVFITSTYKKDATVLNGIALPTKTDGKVDLSKVTVTGAVDSIEDIEAKDVVKAYATKGATKVKLLVVRDSIEGKVTKANNAGTSVYVDALDKTVTSRVVFKSDDTNKFFNVEGTFYLDENGNIFNFIPKTAPASSTNYAMVTKVENGVMLNNGDIMFKNPAVTVINAAGESTKYTIAEDAEYKLFNVNGTTSTTGQAYTVNGAGTSAVLDSNINVGSIVRSVVIEDDVVIQIVLQTAVQAGTTGTNTVNTKAKTFNPASNVAVFNYNSSVTPNVKTANTIEDLIAMGTVLDTNFRYILNAKGEYSVILVQGTNIVTPPSSYALVTAQQKVVNADGKTVQELVVYVNGEKITYLTKPGVADLVSGKDMVQLTISGGIVTNAATVTAPTPFVATTTGSAITSVLATRFQANGQWYFMDDNAPIYVVDKNNKFVRVGAMSDLESLNVDIYVYHTGNIVSNIVVKLK